MARTKSANIGDQTAGSTSDKLYRSLFESTTRGLAIARVLCGENGEPFDLDFLDVNAAFQEQAGLGDARAKRVRESAFGAEQQNRWVGACGQAASSGGPQQFEHQFGGRSFEVSTFRVGVGDESLVAIVLDEVTRLDQANLELKRQRELLHSITDVLVATKMQISLTQSAIQEPGLRELLDKASRLIDDSIGQSRALAVQTTTPSAEYESGLIPGLTQLAAWMEQNHQLRVVVKSNADLKPENQEAAVALFAATRELLFNVIKHAHVQQAWVTVTEKDGRLQLLVEDKGIGFDPGLERKKTKPGTGLVKARERLRRIGGEMKVESEPGKGTRVTVFAPTSVSQASAQAFPEADATHIISALDAEADETREQTAIRVLLVDDHQVLRQGLASLLESEEGIEVVGQAADGCEAIELARQLRPDVATMDISMPRMNGIDATRQIKSEMPEVRIIGLSMHGEKEQAKLLFQAGVDAYLSKGGPSDELIRTIRRIVRKNTGAS